MAVVTADMAVSVDGFVAGPDQGPEAPFGTGPSEEITRWMFEAAEDDADEIAAMNGADAYVMGRNMFGPDRGPFDLDWQGWWGPTPPYGAPVFVLSHHERDPLHLNGTTFTFVNGGITAALDLARQAAGDGRVDIAGGAHTVNQYLAVGLIDELRLHIAPVIMGRGARLLQGVPAARLEAIGGRVTTAVAHLTYRIIRDS